MSRQKNKVLLTGVRKCGFRSSETSDSEVRKPTGGPKPYSEFVGSENFFGPPPPIRILQGDVPRDVLKGRPPAARRPTQHGKWAANEEGALGKPARSRVGEGIVTLVACVNISSVRAIFFFLWL